MASLSRLAVHLAASALLCSCRGPCMGRRALRFSKIPAGGAKNAKKNRRSDVGRTCRLRVVYGSSTGRLRVVYGSATGRLRVGYGSATGRPVADLPLAPLCFKVKKNGG